MKHKKDAPSVSEIKLGTLAKYLCDIMHYIFSEQAMKLNALSTDETASGIERGMKADSVSTGTQT
jgi:hypothetical protein